MAEARSRVFGAVVRDLLLERGYTTAIGNPNWAAFVLELDGVHYETLRKAVTAERVPSPKLMEQVAKFFEVEPTLFREYDLWSVQREFDPGEVGEQEAYANLERWRKVKK